MMKFVNFTGEETEVEFLKKCIEQWEETGNAKVPEIVKLMQLGAVFSEIRHRIRELESEVS